jgi:hypothetical protein
MKDVSSKDLYYLATYLRQEMKKRSGPFPLFIHALEFLDNYKFFMDEKDRAK